MKRLPLLLLIASLGANALLLVRWLGPRDGMYATGMDTRNVTSGSEPRGKPTGKTTGPQTSDWNNLQHDDAVAFRDRLRASGFPREIVRALVEWKILESFRPRRNAAIESEPPLGFWGSRNSTFSRRVVSELQKISREQLDAVRAVLGDDAPVGESDGFNRAKLSFLDPAKASEVIRLFNDYDSLRNQLSFETSGMRLPEDREKFALLDREMRKDLEAMLTPAELEAYDLRRSPAALSLRSQLASFRPTEAEYKTLLQFRRDQMGNAGAPTDQESTNQYVRVRNEMSALIKRTFGEARYADYERSQDTGFRATEEIVRHFNLPRENAIASFTAQKEFQKRADEINGSQTRSPEEKRAAQLALAAETFATFSTLLTPAGAAAYRDSPAGYWLRPAAPTRR